MKPALVIGLLALWLPGRARAGEAVEAPRVSEVPSAAVLAPPVSPIVALDLQAAAGSAALASVPEPAPSALVSSRWRRWRRPQAWETRPEEIARYQAAVQQAKAELDALFIGPGPAQAAAPETLGEKLLHPLAYRPSPEWAASGWVEKSAGGWRLIVPGAAPLPVARWSSEGNPIVFVPPTGGGVVFKPTQERFYAHGKYARYGEGGRMTRLTRSKPLEGFFDPSASPPTIGIRSGHHRFAVANKTGQAVYVEITGVRRPMAWEKREGRWGSPIF